MCHCVLSFFSSGFPIEKAVAYIELRKPFSINDLNAEFVLRDRREVCIVRCDLHLISLASGLCSIEEEQYSYPEARSSEP